MQDAAINLIRQSASLGHEIQHRHADGQAIGDLRQDSAVGPVGDFAADFYAAVHGAGVHHEDAGLAAGEAVTGQAE